MSDIEPVHRWAYREGHDPIEWAAFLAALHIEARDEARAGKLAPGVPLTLMDLDDVAVGRRIVASLLNAGWTPPALSTPPDNRGDDDMRSVACRSVGHGVAGEVAADEVGHDCGSAAVADGFPEPGPEVGVGADDAGGFGVSVGGSVLGHGSSISGGLPPCLVPDTLVDIHHPTEVAAMTEKPVSEMTDVQFANWRLSHLPWIGGTVDQVADEMRSATKGVPNHMPLDGLVRAAALGMIRGTAYQAKTPAARVAWIDVILAAVDLVLEDLDGETP